MCSSAVRSESAALTWMVVAVVGDADFGAPVFAAISLASAAVDPAAGRRQEEDHSMRKSADDSQKSADDNR